MQIIEEQKNSFEELSKTGLGFAYSPSIRHPKMKPFISTVRNNVEIFDLEKIKSRLEAIVEFVKALGKDKKTILFTGTKKEAKEAIKGAGKELNMPYIIERWPGGLLTNFKEIKKRIDYLNDLIQKKSSGELVKFTKKEQLQIEKKITKMDIIFQGLKEFKELPSAIVIVDSGQEKTAISEAKQMGIPIIALMNSDCNPDEADYFVPGNDSSLSSINYFLRKIVDAYKQ